MPLQQRNTAKAAVGRAQQSAKASLRQSADQLYRAASESLRQRERYSRLVASAALESEQHAALRVACLCDEILRESTRGYGAVAESSRADEDWRHRANALWQACREYERRHHTCDESARQMTSRKPNKFKQLALEFDLEASALLALRLALAAYRKVCPDCQLDDRQTFVA